MRGGVVEDYRGGGRRRERNEQENKTARMRRDIGINGPPCGGAQGLRITNGKEGTTGIPAIFRRAALAAV
jgi:hypothetical protein